MPDINDDIGHLETEALIKRLTKQIERVYNIATTEMQKKLDEYLRKFAVKDKIWRNAVENGTITQEDYIKRRTNQILMSQRWRDMLDVLARDAMLADMKAMSIVKGFMPEAYAVNINYTTYQIEHLGEINTSFTLYDRATVERLWRENPKLLPDPSPTGKTAKKLKENKDLIWNRDHINEQIRQAVIQGEDITKISERLRTVTNMDKNAAIRNGRTMMTSAQNAGRIDENQRANDMDIETTLEWCATLDGRTRTSHRYLHGTRIKTGGKFANGLRYPGDPDGAPYEIYNCRCTLLTWVAGFEPSDKVTSSPKMGDMSYSEWLEATPKSNPITLPKEKGKVIEQWYINKYRIMAKG